MQRRIFKVLLIDDTREVLRNLKDWLIDSVTVDGETTKIVVETLHVEMEQIEGGHQYQITEKTIQSLAVLCQTKYDYIFSDFAFIGDRNKNEEVRKKLLNENRGVSKADIDGFVLHLKDIEKRFHELSTAQKIREIGQNAINDKFLKHQGKVLIYTNSPEPFANLFSTNQLPIRIREVSDVFKESSGCGFILMHDEFSITPQIDSLFNDNVEERKSFYSLLLSKRLNSLLQYAALEYLVISQGKLRVTNTKIAWKIITGYGIGLGLVIAMFGEILYHFTYEIYSDTKEMLGLEPDISLLGKIAIWSLLLFVSFVIFPHLGVWNAKKVEEKLGGLLEDEV